MFTATADRQAIGALNPRAVVGYLRDKGWEKKRDFGENAAIFGVSINGTEHELLVPIASQASDFRPVMEVLIDDLVRIEDRSPHDLLSDLTMAAFDVIQIRSPNADNIGSAPLRVGVELHECARDLILSAANVAASDRPRAIWAGRRPEQVNDYLTSIRLAQSQRGSFVISLLSPWDFTPSNERDQGDLEFTEPFGRRAAMALAKALDAAGKALRASAVEGVQRPFEAAVQSGVSSNLCQALAQMARDGDGADISIRWSLTKPAEGRPMLRLGREDAQSFTEAAESLSQVEPLSGVALRGVITNLKEEPNAFDGVTTLETVIDRRLRRVTVTFAKDDTVTRDALIDAFKRRNRISVTGELVREGRRLRLEKPRDFAVSVPSDDE